MSVSPNYSRAFDASTIFSRILSCEPTDCLLHESGEAVGRPATMGFAQKIGVGGC